MAVQYLHGIETVELQSTGGPVSTVKSNVIAVFGTAPLADPTIFPLNTPVALFSDPVKAEELGVEGTLLAAVRAIYAQGAAVVVVIRVAEGTSETPATKQAETWSNVVGSVTAKTGVWAALKARPTLKVVPKILVAPGLTEDRPVNGVANVNVSAGGTGYVAASTTVTFAAAPAGGRTAKGRAQVVGGAVTGIVITDPGFGYSSAPAVTITGAGTGATATAAMGAVANPVAKALEAVAERLRAVAFLDAPRQGTYADAIAYRGDFNSQRVMILYPGVLVWDTVTSDYVAQPSSPYAAGIQARVDETDGFWHSFSNREILNIGGSAVPIDWAMSDPDSEANMLNAAQITTIIHDDGFRFWGVRGTGSDPLWAHMSVRRTADMIYESLEKAHRDAMDKPFSYALLDFISGSVQHYLDLMRSRSALIGGKCWIDATVNTRQTFAAGELTVDFDLEPPALLEHLIFRARRNTDYYSDFVQEFARRVAL